MRTAVLTTTLLFASVTACEKTTKPGPEPQGSPTASAGASSAAPATPAASKDGPAPDDANLANVAPVPFPPESVTMPLVTGSNAFAFDLWQRLSTTPGNLTFSPASISLAVAMAYGGANGATASEIKKALHFSDDGDKTGEGWGKVSRAMTSPGRPLKLRIANRLYGEKTYKFEQAFLDKTSSSFGAPLELVDFKTAPEPARLKVNAWVEDRTEKRIKDLLPPNAVNEATRMVIVNAIYFLADWEAPFDKDRTRDAPFNVNGAAPKNVPTMHERGRYAFAQVDGVKVVSLRYKENPARMVVVMPDKVDGLAALEKTITSEKLSGWMGKGKVEEIDLALPRFEVSPPTMPIAPHPQAMGMTSAFDAKKADFTGIGNVASDRLYVSSVFHKAFVKVDEKGTEAAAATALVAAGGGAPKPVPEVKLDHPFLFFIVDSPTGLILFMGRVTDPSAK